MSDDSEIGQIVNEDGSFTEGWMDKLPEELREDETLKAMPDFSSMAKMLVSGQKMVGKDKIVLPGKEATDEEWMGVFNKLGRPEKSDGYVLEKPDLPEGVPWNEDAVTAFKEVAHKSGMLPKQVKDIFDWYNTQTIDGFAAQKTANETSKAETIAALKTEWGPKYDENLEGAKSFVRNFVSDGDKETLEAGLGDNPAMVRMFHNLGKMVTEGKLKGVEGAGSPVEAQSEINKILGDPTHAYHDKKHPEHTAAVAAMQELYTKIYPSEDK